MRDFNAHYSNTNREEYSEDTLVFLCMVTQETQWHCSWGDYILQKGDYVVIKPIRNRLEADFHGSVEESNVPSDVKFHGVGDLAAEYGFGQHVQLTMKEYYLLES